MLKELIEKRLRLHAENVELITRAKKDGRDVLNADEEQEWQSRDAAFEAVTRQIERLQKQEEIEKRLAEVDNSKGVVQRSNPMDDAPVRHSSQAIRAAQRSQRDMDLALRAWFLRDRAQPEFIQAAERVGMNLRSNVMEFNLSPRAPRSLAEAREWELRGTDPQSLTAALGGYTVPDEMMQAIERALLWFGGMRQAATVMRTATGADLPIPTVNDTANKGAILDENTQVTTGDVAFSQLVLKSFKYTSKQVLVSVELMQDSATNMAALLGELLGERIGRIQNDHFTTGAGTTLPFGIVVRATAGVTTAGSVTSGITYAHLVDLEHSVDIAYRQQGAAFMMHDVMVGRIKKIVDDLGRPVWQPMATSTIANAAGSTLLGYPVVINNSMITTATNTDRAVLFGALQKYIIRDVLGITLLRLDERYADYHQVAFLAFARADGDLLNAGTNPVKYFAFAT